MKSLSFMEAKARFVHRYAMEHVPSWVHKQAPNGKYYAPQYSSDAEWYNLTEFPPENGSKKYCTSNNPTWPLGMWLDKPYVRGNR